ncbi:MAG: hypothetical protein J6N21_12475 [Butyrivibrio sp.]|nr:hypothetical protein [Butyrivibrio sp.]
MITSKKFKHYIKSLLVNFKEDFLFDVRVKKPVSYWDYICGIWYDTPKNHIEISRRYMTEWPLWVSLPLAIFHEVGHCYFTRNTGLRNNRDGEIFADKFAVEMMVRYNIHFILFRLFMFFVYKQFKRIGLYRLLYHYYHVLIIGINVEDWYDVHPFDIQRFLYCWGHLIKLRLHLIKKSQ